MAVSILDPSKETCTGGVPRKHFHRNVGILVHSDVHFSPLFYIIYFVLILF